MFLENFLKTLTDEEYGVLHLIVYNAIVRTCNFEPDIEMVKMLRKNITLQQIDKLKKKVKEESAHILDSLAKKIQEYNA